MDFTVIIRFAGPISRGYPIMGTVWMEQLFGDHHNRQRHRPRNLEYTIRLISIQYSMLDLVSKLYIVHNCERVPWAIWAIQQAIGRVYPVAITQDGLS